MHNPLAMPPVLIGKYNEINQLVEEYPEFIPIPVLAKFLHTNAEGLRYSIENGQCPFGIAWQKSIRGNKAFKVPTLTFYLWYTQCAGVRYCQDKHYSTKME